jgi:hypothetical protein
MFSKASSAFTSLFVVGFICLSTSSAQTAGNIVSTYGQKCVDISGGNAGIQPCVNGAKNQLFAFNFVQVVSANIFEYQIVAQHSNKCLQVKDNGTIDGTKVVQASCSTDPSMLWTVSRTGLGIMFKSPFSAKCLNLPNPATAGNGTQLEISSCDYRAPGMLFTLEAKGASAGSSTPCTCTTPRKVPSQCEVKFLINLLDIAVSGNHKLAPQWLRLSFHDAGTFNKAVPEGGANGCLMNHPAMRLQPENEHLDVAINTLKEIRDNWEQLSTTCIDVSSADIIQFAGFFASLRQTGAVPGMTPAKISQLFTFKWGRADEAKCIINWSHNLPVYDLKTSSVNLPLRCKMAGKEIKTKMMDRNGFTAEEATALIGAHTIGLTRGSFGSAFADPWAANGADDATPTGPVFDNTFFSFMTNNIVAKTTSAFQFNRAPFTNIFPAWVNTKSPTAINFLDTDLALAFPPESTADHPDYHANTVAFSNNNEFFLQTFNKALTKMGMLGVTANLTAPAACSSCQASADPITVSTIQQLVSNLGDAVATADASMAVQQDLHKDQRANLTTAVDSLSV